MNLKSVLINGNNFDLGTRIGKGGEGEIYTVEKIPDLALKIYTTKDRLSKESKIQAMISLGLSSKSSLVSFPISIVRNHDGNFLGFAMKLVNGHKPLHDLYAPGSRKIHFPQADYRFLVRTVVNISKAVATVHNSGCVIGDINHSSMLISSKATVALIDADSFQISRGQDQFLCKVGVPEYTPPELQGINLSSIQRTSNHDAFGLAIIIFQILFMGRHPFVGSVRRGEIPPLHENIKNFKYVYTEHQNVGMDQPPGTPLISDFSPKLASLFDKAFLKDNSTARPTAENWINVLEELEQTLVKCDDNPLHFIPRDASECAWCEMEQQLSTILFLPYYSLTFGGNQGVDPGSINFNIDHIWRQIETISIPLRIDPRLDSFSPSPSSAAISAKPSKISEFNSPIIGGLAILALVFVPQLFFIWIFVIWWGFSKSNLRNHEAASPFIKNYQDIDRRFHQEKENWYQRIGFKALKDLKQELAQAKDAYKNASLEEQKLIQKYKNDRMERQLNSYLDAFDISRARVKGIGPAKEAALASYGITTASDISKNKLLSVPGFGEITSQPLLTWRDGLVKKFVYQSSDNDIDRQEIAKIKYSTQMKLSQLRKKLSMGVINLTKLDQQIKIATSNIDPVLNSLNKQKSQLGVDILFLGGALPLYSAPSSFSHTPSTSNSGNKNSYSGYSPKSTSSYSCPRCGSSMIKRLAKRGRNAGNYFWGCSRYPGCKGTRN